MPYLLGLLLILSLTGAQAQGWSSVPDEITFANVPIHLTTRTRQQIQRELEHLYSSPRRPQQELDALRRLMPLWRPFLKKASLPDDYGLLALPFSDADTLGYWALSTSQAQQLNLHIDKWVDERYHPLNSTEAVLAKLQSWQQRQPTVITALFRYLEWGAQTQHQQLIDQDYVQPDEQSPAILWKLLARKVALTAPSLIYRPTADSINYVYPLADEQTLQDVAQRLSVTLDQLKVNNRWLKTEWLPAAKDYSLIVPLTRDGFLQAEMIVESGDRTRSAVTGFPVLSKTIWTHDPLRWTAQYYQINQRLGVQAQNCDNLITLSYYGKMSVRTFLKYNDLPDEKAVIKPGQIYYLEAKSRRAKVPFHVLQPNQTLLEVANVYGIRLKSLLSFNRLETAHRLPAGRLLWLQKKRPSKQPAAYVQLPQPPARPSRPLPKPDSVTAPQPLTLTTNVPTTSDSKLYSFGGSLLADTASKVEPTPVEDTLSTSLPDAEEVRQPDHWHVVQLGQTYYSISRLYKISLQQLYSWNQLSATVPLRVGQSLRIQKGSTSVQPTNQVSRNAWHRPIAIHEKSRSPILRKALFYTVQAGQTLYRIALVHKVRVKDIVGWNNLKSIGLETGQILLIWR